MYMEAGHTETAVLVHSVIYYCLETIQFIMITLPVVHV